VTRFFMLLFAFIGAIIILIASAIYSIANADVVITIVKSEQRMYVETPSDYFEWPVSTGRKGYNTPDGDFQPYLLKRLHYSKKYDNAPMPWSIFFLDGYAIHATGEVENLGTPASHGCVRLELRNARWLYRLIDENGKENTYIRIVD
jgi:lipoprotein-anchoring transpeptidase ErfK/SrfK